MTGPADNPPPIKPLDPVLQEQLEIQLRSQYRWAANNTWIYWPAIALFGLLGLVGVALLVSAPFSEHWGGQLFGAVIALFVGLIGTPAMWDGYRTAREMAEKLKRAEAQGR